MPSQTKEGHCTARPEAKSAPPVSEYLPDDSDARALKRRMVRVVAAVRGGMISLPQALERFGLTVEEFVQWERDVGKDLARMRRRKKTRRMRPIRSP